MTLRITIDIFSGRPNPVVTVDGHEAKDLLERLAAPRKPAAASPPRRPTGTLGYRGLIIEQVDSKRDRKFPRAFRVAAGHLYGVDVSRPVADSSVEDFVCGSTGPIRFAPGGPRLSEYCLEEIRRFHHVIRHYHWRHHRHPHRIHCHCAPLYEPQWWNDGGPIQWSNNCYNYASDYRSDTFAQPGLAAGAEYQQLQCPDVRNGAIADQLILAPKKNKCPKEGHLVALVVAPNSDFHWYRKGRNGYWSHKPGGTPVTNVDNSGNPIPDPRTADRGGYTDFCSFMIVMHGHIKLR